MGGLRSGGGAGQPLAEINVTPFVDVMLVLLIIFMVAAPMMQQGEVVDLPETESQPMQVREDPLILTVKKDGTILIGKTKVGLDELEGKLHAIFENRDDKDLYLRADEAAAYGHVAKAMAAARRAGATRLGMVTEQPQH